MASRRSWFRHPVPAGLLLLLAVLLAYQPVWHAGYLWDDDTMLTANPCIVGPLGFKEIWTTRAADICPLTITTFWLEHKFWGLAPLPYHLVNVLLHAACAVLLWRVLRYLRVPGAWLGAALWALHPVEVESVAWVSEMKNTQSGVFCLLTALCFLHARGTSGIWPVELTWLCAALAMASKSSAMVLPAVLGLLAWWQEGRWRRRTVLEVGAVVLLSLAAGALSLWTQVLSPEAAVDPLPVRSWLERSVAAANAVWFYLGKLVWPHPLIAVYPRWEIDLRQASASLPLLALLALLLMFWWQRRAWARPWLLMLAGFLAVLFPVLGPVEIGYFRHSFVADHFLYMASMGALAAAGAGLVWLAHRFLPERQPWQIGAAAVLLLVLGLASWQRARVFENSETLSRDTLAKNPRAWVAYDNLGSDLIQQGRLVEAIVELRESVKIHPSNVIGHNNLGKALLNLGRVDEAIDQFQEALKIYDRHAPARNNLGLAFIQKGRFDDAIDQYEQIIRTQPDFVLGYINLGTLFFNTGRVDDAVIQFQKALQVDDKSSLAHSKLGAALLRRGQVDEALTQYREAVRTNPTSADVRCELGNVLLQTGQLDAAIAQYQETLKIDDHHAAAHRNLGNALLQKGRADEAIAQFQAVLKIDPRLAEIRYNLGNILLRQGRVDEAIVQYKEALEIDDHAALVHGNLGAALLQKGLADDAIAQYREALRIDPNDASTHHNLGVILARTWRLDEAAAHFREAIRLKGDYPEAERDLITVQAMMQQAAGTSGSLR